MEAPGGVPPAAPKVCRYATPTAPVASRSGEITGAAHASRVKLTDATGEPASAMGAPVVTSHWPSAHGTFSKSSCT